MSKIRIGGCDPGFTNVAFSAMDLYPVGASTLLATRLVVTAKGKGTIRVIDDELRRIREIEDAFIEFIDEWHPEIWAMEEPGKALVPKRKPGPGPKFSVNPKTLRTQCLMWGAIEGVCRSRGIYVVQYTSQEIKKVICSSNKASKADMEQEIRGRYGDYTGWATSKKREHEFDAVGAAVTSFKEPFVMALLRKLEAQG
jgi:Holliday junction resolvasome RuvABC endonuclease subunit